jgi:hypothetical protein
MTDNVFANGREIACQAGSGKTIAAFPDVCFTPPENPATPPGVPVPYPNNGYDSDTVEGSKTVNISDKEIMLKDQSYFKKSEADDAGKTAKKGVITSVIDGKVFFNSWSMDVKVEGENVDRHFDLTTNNHASKPGNTPTWPFVKSFKAAVRDEDPCVKEKDNETKACKDYKPNKPNGKDVCEEAGLMSGFSYGKGATTIRARNARENPCAAARKCKLVKYNATEDGVTGCCPAQTPDHIIPKSSFFKTAFKTNPSLSDFVEGWDQYDYKTAPCMCLEGGSNSGSHGLRHAYHKSFSGKANGTFRSFNDEAKFCAESANAVAPNCSKACIEAQLKEGHSMGDQRKQIKHSSTGKAKLADENAFTKLVKAMFKLP